MKRALTGISLLLLTTLLCTILYFGLLTLAIQPGHVNQAGGFTIERDGPYLDLPTGRVHPVNVVETDGVVTYTFVVKRK